MKLFRNPIFWLVFTGISFVSGYLGYRYFSRAFPIVTIDLTMNRLQAIRDGNAIAHQFNLGPKDAQEATMFHLDEMVKTFIELEAGGKQAFTNMMEKNLYQPYTWQVRRFKEFEPNQTVIVFTPSGKPYGFVETISENTPGNNLTATQAQALAEQVASSEPWQINFGDYKQVEASQEKQPSERIDHTFLYERPTIKIGDGFYQLRIRVSGDHVSEINHSVKVPETFIRKYTNMRSANENIAYAAKLALMLLYVIGGCIIGLFFLLRDHWVLWKVPLFFALLISGMTTLQHINELPIRWMYYNTAYSTTAFIMQQLIAMLMEFIYWVFILFVSFTAAESLTRKAFKNQLQLWRMWTPQVASSFAVLGRTIGGYLLVPMMLLFIVFFYIYTTTFLGWWTPSSALFNPNILATYLPWWESIAVSFRAGFWEECLFRAVPLASAALLGERYGKRNWWIIGAFILQAVIFGAAHANYPAQPSYARLIELLAVSSLFGGVYLRFGLLPAAITHFVYDVMWFSLPIFISHASNAFINKTAVIIATLIPLFIVLYARIKSGSWFTLPKTVYNFAWKPSQTKTITQPKIKQKSITLTAAAIYTFMGIGVISAGLWIHFTQFTSDGLAFTVYRADAFKKTAHILERKKIDPTNWYPMVSILTNYEYDELNNAQRFVWQEGNNSIYRNLLGTYLTPPYWLARYVKFDGPLTERAEEHRIYLMPDGSLYRYKHILPENQAGEKLEKNDAKPIAYAAIFKQFNLQPEELIDVSAVSQKRPDRLDWVFTFAHEKDYPLKQGQARIEVTIGGNKVIDLRRYLHVPEQWQRADENKQLIANIIKQSCALFIYLVIIFGSLYAFMQWSIGIPLKTLIPFTCALAIIFLFELFNSWPAVIAYFNTSQPFTDQLFRSFAIQSISLCMRAAVLGLLFSFILHWKNHYRLALPCLTIYTLGVSMGFILAGSLSILEKYIPALEPQWPNYAPLSFAFPLNAGINSHLLNFVSLSILLLLSTIILNTFKNSWVKLLSIFIFSIITMGISYSGNISLWLTSSICVFGIYSLGYMQIGRYTLAIVPPAVMTYFSLYAIQQAMFNDEPYAQLIAGCSIIIMALLAWFWSKKLSN